MLEIAGGILIAVAVLLALPYLLAGAYFAVSFGIAIGIAIGIWFVLASVVGTGWAWTISIAAVITWLGWSGLQEEKERQAQEELKAEEAEKRTREEQARREIWASDDQARREHWAREEQARKELEENETKARRAAYVAKKEREREFIKECLSEGAHTLRDINGNEMPLQEKLDSM